MPFHCVAIGLIGLLVSVVPAGEEPAPAPGDVKVQTPTPPLADQIAKISQDFKALEKAFHEELVAAKRDNEKVLKANRDYQKTWRTSAESLIALIKKHDQDPAALDGILELVGTMHWPLDPQLLEIASRHHDDPKMGRLCFDLRYRGGEAWAERLLKETVELNPDKTARGQAVFAFGEYYRDAAFPWGRQLPESEVAAKLAKARQYYGEAKKDYADILTPDGKSKLGDKASHELARLDNLPNLKVGGLAPEIQAETLEGTPLKLSDHRGKVVVIVFWGSWCGPCMALVPHERELAKRLGGKPFVLLGVNCGDPRDKAKKTASDRQMTWPSWWDGEDTVGPIETDYNVKHWPTVHVIDSKGVIRGFDVGRDKLDQVVDQVLVEMAEK